MTGAARADDELLTSIWTALDTTGVWVAPELAREVAAEDLAEIQDAVADSPVPLYVVVQPLRDGDAFGGDPAELLTQLHDDFGADGVYLAPQFFGGPDHVNLVDRAWGSEVDAWQAGSVAEHRHGDGEGRIDDLGAYLADVARLVSDGDAQEAWEEEVQPTLTTTTDPGGTATSPDDGPPVLGLVGAGLAVLLVAAVVVRRRKPRTFTLPDSVVDQLREAHADRVEQQARTLVLELGEAVHRSDLDADHDAGAWQAALDHYEAATRVLDRSQDLGILDAVGALVLARQGRAALDAATSGHPFVPLRLCYLNPLHDAPTKAPLRLEQHGRTLTVPVCSTCRADLKAHRDPDALRVPRGRRAVLYVDSGVEPWASTAYGSLGTGLVGALHQRR